MSAQTAVIRAETSAATAGTRARAAGAASAGSRCHQAPGSLGAAGQPALLPAAAVLAFQPVQQRLQPPGFARAGRRPGAQLPTCSRPCAVAGHSAAAGRGGNRVRAAR